MLEPWLAWRLLKFLGIALFTAGLAGAFARSQRRRLVSVHVVATLGLATTWLAGYGLTKISGASIRDPWVLTSLFASLLALHEAAAMAERPRVLAWNVGLLIGAYACAVGSMVARLPGTGHVVASFAIPALLAGLGFGLGAKLRGAFDYEPAAVKPAVHRWFVWIARLEGASLLGLVGVYMPLKYGADIVLDGGQGWFGWVHGVMVLIFMQALWSAWRRLEWSLGRAALGFGAAMLPFGSYVFERKLPAPDAQ